MIKRMINKNRVIKAMPAPTLALLVVLMAVSAGAQQDFTLVIPSGQPVSLAEMRSKVVVLLFGGINDPQCRDEFKALNALTERYRGKDVAIYWVSVDPPDVSDERIKNPCGPPGSVLILRDSNRTAFRQFSGRAPQLPTVAILNKQGQIYGQPRGGFNPNDDFVNDLAVIIDSLLGQR